jgi:methylmalonyl-CoA mutase
MSAPTDPVQLGDGFPAASYDDWVALVAGVLRKAGRDDADPVAALTATTYDGIPVRPLYTAADRPGRDAGWPGSAPYVRGASAAVGGWDVRQRHAGTDPARVRAALLNDLETGATSAWLVLGAAGLPVEDLAAALEGVYVDLAPIALDAGASTPEAAAAFLALVRERDLDPAEIRGSLGADPIGLRARTGATADLGVLVPRGLPAMQLATVDATVHHDAGAGDAVELAAGTAVGVAYLRALTDAGLDLDAALDAIEFRFAVTADQFASIAKLRAARQLWGRVAELSGAAPDRRGQRQHAVTSAAMMTRRDPWVNMLRTTLACFAAAVGGADAITVLPFDAAIGQPDDLSRRIARNTQTILHDESSLGRVLDAAGGSFYVEARTEALAEVAWDHFTAIERAGGALAALDAGLLGELAAATRERRRDDVNHRRAALTGVTEFAFPDEPAVPRAAGAPPLAGGPLVPVRWAAEFEALRDAVEAVDPRPAVYLATVGPPAVHAARLGFARNLFQAGGFRVLTGPAEDHPGTPVACLCSSDTLYSAEAVTALRAAGAFVWLAGKGELGADGYVFAGCDALAVLRTTADRLGVPR